MEPTAHSRLAELLCEEGLLAPAQAVEAIERQVLTGGTVDTAILELGLLSETQLLEGLQRATELPALLPPRPAENLDRDTLASWFPLALAERFQAVPVAKDRNVVRVAVTDPVDRARYDELGFMLSMSIEPLVVTESRFAMLVAELYGVTPSERYQRLRAHLDAGRPGPLDAIGEPPTPLQHAEAISLIAGAKTRDEVLVAALRALRHQLAFCAAFVLRGQELVGKLGLHEAWISPRIMLALKVDLSQPSALSACYKGRAPYLGLLGGEPTTAALLQALGRPERVPGVLFPIRIADRVLAVILGDRGGRPLAPKLVTEAQPIVDAVAKRFEAIIMESKQSTAERTAQPTPGRAQTALARATQGGRKAAPPSAPAAKKKPAPDELPGVTPTPIFDRDTGPVLDLDVLVRSVLIGDEHAQASADQLLGLADKGLNTVVERYFARLSHPQSKPPDRDPIADRMLVLLRGFGVGALAALSTKLTRGQALGRRHAAYLLHKLAPTMPAALQKLEPLLYEPENELRATAITALREAISAPQMGADARTVLERLRGELPGPDVNRQRFAIEAVGLLRDAASIPRLIELVRDTDSRLSDSAREALRRLTAHDYGANQRRWRTFWDKHRDDSRAAWLVDGLDHSDKRVRHRAHEELRLLAPLVADGGYHPNLGKVELDKAIKRWIGGLKKLNVLK